MTGRPGVYDGYYINLDRSPDRRARLEAHLASLGLSELYSRFAAVDGAKLPAGKTPLNPSQVGVFHSHRDVLKAVRPGRLMHVMEDDAVLSDLTRPMIEYAAVTGLFGQYDVIFTDAALYPTLLALKQMKERFDAFAKPGPLGRLPRRIGVLDLAQMSFSALASYVVSPRGAERLIAIYDAEIRRGPTMPVDILFRQAVQAGQLRAGCFFPFVSTIDLIQSEASTINESHPHDSVLMTALLRYSFFVDRDLAGSAMPALAGILERTPSLETDLHLKLIHGAMGFLLSERYQNF